MLILYAAEKCLSANAAGAAQLKLVSKAVGDTLRESERNPAHWYSALGAKVRRIRRCASHNVKLRAGLKHGCKGVP